MSAEHANALQAPAQHMMPQASSSPSLQQDSSPAPMAVQMAPSMSGDMDMDNVESSADSVIPSMSLQVCVVFFPCAAILSRTMHPFSWFIIPEHSAQPDVEWLAG